MLADLDSTDGSTVEKISYTGCSDNGDVVYLKVTDGGHTWPGADPAYSGGGRTNRDFSASVEILRFFSEHENPMPPRGDLRLDLVEISTNAAVAGQPTPFGATVVLGRPLEETEALRRMVLDLSPLGIPDDLPMKHVGGGRYAASTTLRPLSNGQYYLPIQVETAQGERHRLLRVPLSIWASADLPVFDDGLAGGGELSVRNLERLDPNQAAVVFTGSTACAVAGKESFAGWTVGFPFPPTGGFGYRALRFAFHPGQTALSGGERFSVSVAPASAVNLLENNRVDMARREWQVVEIPLGLFETEEPYHGVNFSGTLGGLFFVDAVELVSWPDDAQDLVILRDALAPGWEISDTGVERLSPAQTDVVHAGSAACAVQGKESWSGWAVKFQPPDPVNHFDYDVLRFALHPGDVALSGGERLLVRVIPGESVNLLEDSRVDIARQEWQLVEIPLTEFALEEPIESVYFSGGFAATFYLDDLELGAVRPPSRSPTAVREEHLGAMPQAFSLQQSFPNPFNSETVIRFWLPTAGEAELVLYNVAGQRVTILAQGWRPPGAHTVRWDGRDDHGHALASGVYLDRLQVGQRQVGMQKLLLLR